MGSLLWGRNHTGSLPRSGPSRRFALLIGLPYLEHRRSTIPCIREIWLLELQMNWKRHSVGSCLMIRAPGQISKGSLLFHLEENVVYIKRRSSFDWNRNLQRKQARAFLCLKIIGYHILCPLGAGLPLTDRGLNFRSVLFCQPKAECYLGNMAR